MGSTQVAPPLQQQSLGFFTYLRYKIIVSLLRLLFQIKNRKTFQSDKLLSEQYHIHTERVRIPSRDLGRFIAADLYHPPSASPPNHSPTPRPVLVNIHGSGFIFPGHGSDALMCARVAHDLDVFVLDVDYRKAPETCFPGPLNDVEDALRWVSTTQSSRFDTSQVAISGSSSGATLALVAATALRDNLAKMLSVVAVATIYPGTDLYSPPEEKQAPKNINPILPPAMAHLFYNCYVPDKTTRRNPYISPVLADPASFPPTAVFVMCEGDVFAAEGLALAARIEEAGKSHVVKHMLEGVPHGFDKGCQEGSIQWTRREEAYQLIVDSLKSAWKL